MTKQWPLDTGKRSAIAKALWFSAMISRSMWQKGQPSALAMPLLYVNAGVHCTVRFQNRRRNYAQERAVAQMHPDDTRISNPRSASNRQKTQSNFFTLPLLCQS